MRKLASIQIIKDLKPIPGADKIEVVQVMGWKVVVGKGEFQKDSLCVFCEIDSVLPERPEFEFLRKYNFRVRTMKLKGQISQGLCLPLSVLPTNGTYGVDTDVTDLLGIKKYEMPIPAQLVGEMKGSFPNFIPKTDEIRVQILQELLDKYAGMKCYVTEKLDGSSGSFFFNNGEFGVCSRNLQLKLQNKPNWFNKMLITMRLKKQPKKLSNTLLKFAEKLQLEKKLKSLKRNIALQGEVIGEGIQKNRYGLKGQQVYFFNAWDIDKQEYLNFWDFISLLEDPYGLHLPIVPLERFIDLPNDMSKLIEMSQGKSALNENTLREGIVVRPIKEIRDEKFGRVSFKVINPEFLLKYEE